MAVKSPREAFIEDLLVRRVEALGGLCIKLASPGRRGCPDRLVLLPGGRVLLVELKREKGGRLSPHQHWWIDNCGLLGVRLELVRDTEDIDALLS